MTRRGSGKRGGMMSSPKNRSPLGIDDPWDDDGFWTRRKFHGHRSTGQATGGRLWRRAVRVIEKRHTAREIAQEMST